MAEATPEAAGVTTAADLPDIRLELHWFASDALSQAFQAGARLAPRNDVALIAAEDLPQALLVAFLSEPRGDGATLEEAVPLVDHGGAGDRRAEVKWRGLRSEAAESGKGLRPLASYLAVDRIDEDAAHVTAAHWKRGPANAAWRVELREDGRYQVTSRRFPYAAAFDGGFGSFDDTHLNRLLAGFEARITPDGQLSFPAPAGDLAGHFRGLEETLLGELYEIFQARERAAERRAIRKDPVTRRLLKALAAGATLRRTRSSGEIVSADGISRRVSRPAIERLVRAGLIRRKDGDLASSWEYEPVALQDA